ncbi:hypothetical protein Poli38472_013050 [Pythium oligandrum]|uniref:CHCH domain-containing protein n=1 Tax=Pythium oligandrum TaxID=41045 RepID=A0A8K1CK47_PYTOL|nr:hypothetical protein Poli38472_013050 [Pythium oligandrum]|eukprot:TMW64428.1 hypothetical protein Poli38472_013050 [Pythium oligandrum]
MSSKKSFTPPVIPGLHAGSQSDFGSDVDIDEMIEKMGCSKDYYKLEECLGEYDRDWTKCQVEVKALKACNDRLQKLKQAQRAPSK